MDLRSWTRRVGVCSRLQVRVLRVIVWRRLHCPPGERVVLGTSGRAICGAQTFRSQTPPPPPIILQMHTPARSSQCWSRQIQHGLGVCIWMHLVNGTGNSPSLGQPTLE